MSIAEYFPLLFAVAGVVLTFVVYDLFFRAHSELFSASEITEGQLWAVEGAISNLRRVIVVAHIVERPNHMLLEAVE